MEGQENNRGKRFRLKDRSLKAFKAWMTEIAQRLTTQKTIIELMQDKWGTSWKECRQQNSRQ